MAGPAGPMDVSEKNQASCEEFSRIADTPSPPAQSAQVEWSEYATHSASSAAGPPAGPVTPNGPSLLAVAARPGGVAPRRDQPGQRDAEPGGDPDRQAGQLASPPHHSFRACTSRMDAAAGHRQKARSSPRSGHGTSW